MASTDSPAPFPVLASGSDQLTRGLLDLIKREELGPGDRLPAVTALAARFAVAPPTIREALRRLQALGILDIRHGSGIYVRQIGERVIVSNPYSGRLEPGTILDLVDARLLIEPHLAGLSAEHATSSSVRAIEEILAGAERALEGEDGVLNDLNLGFHRAVARLSGNLVLAQTIDSLLDLYADEQIVIQRLVDERERDHREHAAILEAIRERRADVASARMRAHLEGIRDVLRRRLETGKR